MHLIQRDTSKCVAIVCSLILSLLSFSLSAGIWKITDMEAAKKNRANPFFYIQVPSYGNGIVVEPNGDVLDSLLGANNFHAELVEDLGQTQTEPGRGSDFPTFIFQGGASLSRHAVSPESVARELTRNLAPAFPVISATIQHTVFRRAADWQREHPHNVDQQEFSFLVSQLSSTGRSGTPDLVEAMNRVTDIANQLRSNGRIAAWHPLMPYFQTESDPVIRLVVTPQINAGAHESRQQFQRDIYNAFGMRPDNLPQLVGLVGSSESDEPSLGLSISPDHDLTIRVRGRTSAQLCREQEAGNLRYPAPSLATASFCRVATPVNPSGRPPRFFLYRAEFPLLTDHTRSYAAETLPGTAVEIAHRLQQSNPLWRYDYVSDQQISPNSRQASVLFTYYDSVNGRIDLEHLWRRVRFSNVDRTITHSLVHWTEMMISPVSLTATFEADRENDNALWEEQHRRGFIQRLWQSICSSISTRSTRRNREEAAPVMGNETEQEQSENRQPGTPDLNTDAGIHMAIMLVGGEKR